MHEPERAASFARARSPISADRPFTMYADGDPIGELPVRVRALRGAVTMLVPAEPASGVREHSRPSRGAGDASPASDLMAGALARQARAGAGRRRDLAPARRRRDERCPGRC